MKPRFLSASLLVAALAGNLAFAQSEAGKSSQQSAPSAARVLAGVREYPEPVVDALVALARHPDWLDKAVTKIKANQDPAADDPAMPEQIRSALKTLAPLPEAILLADARRDELNMLRDVRLEAPQGADVRTRQLRADYSGAKREGALRWQQALQGNSEAVEQYRELLTKFSQEMRKQIPNFAVVEVADRGYYLVCPPDEVIMGFAQQQKAPEAVWRLMTEWYDRFGTDRVDAQLLESSGGVASSQAENALIDGPAGQRKAMFRADDGQLGDSLGLVPIALQPLADQPDEARLAFAIAEHERLWAPQMSGGPADGDANRNLAMGTPQDGLNGAEVRIEPPLEDNLGADVVITPARPEMIIPAGRPTRVIHDDPIVIAGAYDDDDFLVDGDDVDAIEYVDGAPQVVIESGPSVVYDYGPTIWAPRPYYPYSTFGFGFGYSSFGSCYPHYYYPSFGRYSYRPCGRTYSYYPRFCDRDIYYGRGYNRGFGFSLNGNYSDRRTLYSSDRRYDGRYFSAPRGGSRYAYSRDRDGLSGVRSLSQGQYLPNNSGVVRSGPRTRDARSFSSIGSAGQGGSPRSIARPGGSVRSSDGVLRRDADSVRSSDGVRRSQPSVRSNSLRATPRTDLQRMPTRSLNPRSSGSRDGGGFRSLKSSSSRVQTSPAPRSSFNRSSVFRGSGSRSFGGGSRSNQRDGRRN